MEGEIMYLLPSCHTTTGLNGAELEMMQMLYSSFRVLRKLRKNYIRVSTCVGFTTFKK